MRVQPNFSALAIGTFVKNGKRERISLHDRKKLYQFHKINFITFTQFHRINFISSNQSYQIIFTKSFLSDQFLPNHIYQIKSN